MRSVLAAVALLFVLSACGTGSDGSAPTTQPSGSESAAPTDAPEAGSTAPEPAAAETTALAEPETEQLTATPVLPEGPYYPTEAQRPSDRDSDLLLLTGSPAIASGEPLLLDGQLLDTSGSPVSDATVALWQTDVQGVYLHPDDPRKDIRDVYFQSYGEALTGEDGAFSFRTIVPAPYESRPRHLHLKVTLDSVELLTTQIFFAGDAALVSDDLTAGLGTALDAVSVTPTPGVDDAGLAVQRATRIIVIEPPS
ncbi:MAG: hypothetical protein ACR2OD_08945 [Gaiellaceae bacterium]